VSDLLAEFVNAKEPKFDGDSPQYPAHDSDGYGENNEHENLHSLHGDGSA
jgi:hypothetical protein